MINSEETNSQYGTHAGAQRDAHHTAKASWIENHEIVHRFSSCAVSSRPIPLFLRVRSSILLINPAERQAKPQVAVYLR